MIKNPTVYEVRTKMFTNDVVLPDDCDTFIKRIEFELNMVFFIERLAYWSIIDQDNDMPDTIVSPKRVVIKIKGGSILYNRRPIPMMVKDVLEKYDSYHDKGYTHDVNDMLDWNSCVCNGK